MLSGELDPKLLPVNKAGVGSAPSDFTAVGNVTFFVAGDLAHGRELYRTDGTADRTRLVADINPGPASANIHDLTALNGLLLFFADDGRRGEELWRSDGTTGGTFVLADINPGPGVSAPASGSALNTTAVFRDKMFFSADEGTHGTELWATDGTSFGTSPVADINPGAGSSNLAALTVFDGKLYFQAKAGAGGSQLFASDGTASGTSHVKVLDPAGDADPSDFAALGGQLFFAASDGTNGRQLWKTDGTSAGTVEVTAIPGGPAQDPHVRDLTASGGAMYFAADSGLWASDGTAAGTALVAAVEDPSNLTPLHGKVLFGATTPGHAAQLWASDGTATGTTMLTDVGQAGIGLQPASIRGDSESRFATLGGTLYFSGADGPAHGRQLWRSDGTAAGTTMVTDINPIGFGTNSVLLGYAVRYYGSNADRVAAVNGRLFFSADDGPDGSQLWTSRGDSSDTRMLTRLATGTQTSNPTEGYVNVNGITLFDADDGIHGHELWRTDGTRAGTFLVKDIDPGPADSGPHDLTRFDNKLIFAASDGIGPDAHGREIWISDGTVAGTFMIADINPGPAASTNVRYPTVFTEVNRVIYFQASDGTNGFELWRTDGTAAGTRMVKDINPGSQKGPHGPIPNDSTPQVLTAFRGKLYFAARDQMRGEQLWVSDGTTEGTTPVTTINPFGYGTGIYPQYLTVFKGHLFFAASDGVDGTELWVSDGTTAGTVMLDDINPGPGGSYPAAFTAVGNKLFFAADDGSNGRELWATDGTAAGTALIRDINPGPDGSFNTTSSYALMAGLDGVLLFSADDGTHGLELWRSDGTTKGTVPVRDIDPGPGDGIALPSSYTFTVIAGELFFAANDGIHGSQLWVSDGTAAGTRPVSTTLAFPRFDTLKPLANINGSLAFTASDGIHGFQTWIIPADQIEDLRDHGRGGSHEVGGHQEGLDVTGSDAELWAQDAALAATSMPGRRTLVIPGAMPWNHLSLSSRRRRPDESSAVVGGPLAPINIPAPAGSSRTSLTNDGRPSAGSPSMA